MNPETGLCIKCGSEMWNNAEKNKERVAQGLKPMPVFSCKNKACGNVVWPARDNSNPAPQQVSSYQSQPTFSKTTVAKNPAPDWDNIAQGKVRHAFALEAFKRGDKLTDKLATEIQSWTNYVMTGKIE